MSEQGDHGTYCLQTDGFHGELFRPARNSYPGKALICFSGSDGRFEWIRMLAQVFQAHGLTALALAYVMEEGLPRAFYHVPIDPLEAAAKRLHDMGYEKVGLWGISKGAELALTAGSLLPGLVNAVVAVAPMNTVCQGFSEERGITIMPGSAWSFHGEEVPYTPFGEKTRPRRNHPGRGHLRQGHVPPAIHVDQLRHPAVQSGLGDRRISETAPPSHGRRTGSGAFLFAAADGERDKSLVLPGHGERHRPAGKAHSQGRA